MNTFSLKVIACDKVFYDGRCAQVVLPLHDGLKAIQAHHENMVFAVEVGEIRILEENGNTIYQDKSESWFPVHNEVWNKRHCQSWKNVTGRWCRNWWWIRFG